MTDPDPVRIHAYRDGHAAEAVRILGEAAVAEPNASPPSLGEWTAFTRQSFNHGASDFALIEVDGRNEGVLMSARIPKTDRVVRNFRIILHPRVRRRGVGTRVLAHVEGQDPASDTTLQAACLRSWEAGSAFLAARGFRVAWSDVRMVAADAPPPPAPVPAGMTLRPLAGDGGDDDAWLRLTREAYEGTQEATSMVESDLPVLRGEPGFRVRVLEDRGEVLGLCHVKEYGGETWINNLAVDRPRRGEGLGRLLLLDMLAALHADGASPVRLTVREDNVPALRLYESSGFERDDVGVTWWRER